MAVLEVTSRQFREKQKSFFDMADSGAQVVIRRGRKQAYTLTPVDEDDLYFTPEMLAKIDRAIQQAKEGKVVRLTPELRNELFGNL
jgi:hypothetical protein